MKSVIVTIIVLILAVAAGVSLGRFAQAAASKSTDRILGYARETPPILLIRNADGRTLVVRTAR